MRWFLRVMSPTQPEPARCPGHHRDPRRADRCPGLPAEGRQAITTATHRYPPAKANVGDALADFAGEYHQSAATVVGTVDPPGWTVLAVPDVLCRDHSIASRAMCSSSSGHCLLPARRYQAQHPRESSGTFSRSDGRSAATSSLPDRDARVLLRHHRRQGAPGGGLDGRAILAPLPGGPGGWHPRTAGALVIVPAARTSSSARSSR